MKNSKFFRFIGLWVLSALLLVSGALATTGTVNSETIAPDEALVEAILKNTYATSMIFEGSSQNWDCSFIVKKGLAKMDDGIENCPEVTVSIVPKFTWDRYIIRAFNLKVHTSNGCINGNYGLKSGQAIFLDLNAPVPSPSETIPVEISGGPNGDEIIKLSNLVPEYGLITPEHALRKTLEVYYSYYGKYPTEQFTFKVDITVYSSGIYWLVSFDDNDNIGGQSCLTINAYTGEALDMKVDE